MLTARLLRCFKNFGILVYRLVSKIFLCRVTTSMQKKLSLPIIRMEKGLKMTSSSFTAVILMIYLITSLFCCQHLLIQYTFVWAAPLFAFSLFNATVLLADTTSFL